MSVGGRILKRRRWIGVDHERVNGCVRGRGYEDAGEKDRWSVMGGELVCRAVAGRSPFFSTIVSIDPFPASKFGKRTTCK